MVFWNFAGAQAILKAFGCTEADVCECSLWEYSLDSSSETNWLHAGLCKTITLSSMPAEGYIIIIITSYDVK